MKAKHVVDYLVSSGMEMPRIVISLIGSGHNFEASHDLRRTFHTFCQTALETGAWSVTAYKR
jgi:very-short-patch-repair endonuclease